MLQKINLRTLLCFGLVVLIFSIIFGCAAKKAFWGDEKTGFIFNYQLPKDQVWKYQATTKQSSTQEVMGQNYETTTDVVSDYRIKGVALDKEKNNISQVAMDSISLVIKTMQGELKPDFGTIIGKEFGLTFSPKGKKVSFSDPESIKVDFGPMAGKREAESFFRDLFPRLPDNPIKIGDTWSVTEERTEPQGGLKINIKTETVNTLAGFETLDNVECLKITAKTTGTLDGKGKQMGMDVNFEGDLEGSSVWYFAYKKSAFIRASSESLMEGTAALTGPQNLTVSVNQESKSEVKLVLPPSTK